MQKVDTKQQLKDAFMNLPEVLQEAITDANVQEQLRKLAEVHKLHLDKWTVLENEIMMALLGITDPDDLAKNISAQVSVSLDKAQEIADSVAQIVFDPIQEQMRAEIGESQTIVEKHISSVAPKGEIDISKFTPASTDPEDYAPKAVVPYAEGDPYHEAVG